MVISPAPSLRNCLAAALLLVVSQAVPGNFLGAQTSAVRSPEAFKPDSPPNSLSAKERAEIFDEVWETIDEKYYDPKFNGTDWNAVRERYRPQVESAASDREFYALLKQMTGELRDAHTRVLSPQQRQRRKNRQATRLGLLIYEVENTPVIFDVTPDSDAERAGVKAGMLVRTIDGQPIAEALAEARREAGTSSSERATRINTYRKLMEGEPDTQLKLGLTRADGTPLDVTLTRRTVSDVPQFAARLLPSGYAYIRFDRFRAPVDKQIKEALERFKAAPGLILDLRANGGGYAHIGMNIAGYFFDDKVPVARIATRTGKPPSVLFGLVSIPKEFQAGRKGGQLYSNSVVLLVNEGSASASEVLAGAMQEQDRAHIIGTQTCGCVIGVLKRRELKGGGELAVSEIGFTTAKGRTLEGDGITPDQSVAVTLADLQQQRDAALEEAEKYLDGLAKK